MWLSLIEEGVDTVFGYPGGQIMPVYDSLCNYQDKVRHILVRHEQGAIHAAQGYARVGGNPGVVIVTSGPGATNVITGVHDAMTDSTPVVVITGQVSSAALGTDAFQEADVIGLTGPISKWNYQIRTADEVAWAVARAFYIARTGRPGPVVLDFTKDAQVGLTDFKFEKCNFIRSYVPDPKVSEVSLNKAVSLLNAAERPFVVFGQGVVLGHAEEELKAFLQKGDIPAGSTLLGLSALPSDFPLYRGMIGMHGNVAPNIMTNSCDVLVAVGMRFDDRVTGTVSTYARQAKVIHIDIDTSEIGKIIPVEVGLRGDAKKVLALLTERMKARKHPEWNASCTRCDAVEKEKVIDPEVHPASGMLRMGEVVDRVVRGGGGPRGPGFRREGGRGDGRGPEPDDGRPLFPFHAHPQFHLLRRPRNDGLRPARGPGRQGGRAGPSGMLLRRRRRHPDDHAGVRNHHAGAGGREDRSAEQQLAGKCPPVAGTLLLNNNWLGNVRQWQELFFGCRYSETRMLNPDYAMIARAYGISCVTVEKREQLDAALEAMFADDKPFLLDVHVLEEGMEWYNG